MQSVAQFRQAGPKVDGKQVYVGATDPAAFAQALDIPMQLGGLTGLSDRSVLVNSNVASSKHYSIGDTVAMKFVLKRFPGTAWVGVRPRGA